MMDILRLLIKNIASKFALLLKQSGELKHDCNGYDTIQREIDRSILIQEIDYLFPKSNLVRFPEMSG